MLNKIAFILIYLLSNTVLAEHLKVMSYNVLSERYANCGGYHNMSFDVMNYKVRAKKIAKEILKVKPDVVALQEVESDVLGILVDNLKKEYHVEYNRFNKLDKDFLATFYIKDRLEVSEISLKMYPDKRKYYQSLKFVNKKGKEFWFLNTKIKYCSENLPYEEQLGFHQMDMLIKDLKEKSSKHVILCGDFNLESNHSYILKLKEELKDSFENQYYPTINIDGELKRIDYVFHSKNIESKPLFITKLEKNIKLPSKKHPSDHLPVVTNLFIGG